MRKIGILVIILLLILAALITFLLASSEDYLDYYSHTKAICNETNYCQDYQISCNRERAIIITPITGAVIQHSLDWEDPRNESTRNILCK